MIQTLKAKDDNAKDHHYHIQRSSLAPAVQISGIPICYWAYIHSIEIIEQYVVTITIKSSKKEFKKY